MLQNAWLNMQHLHCVAAHRAILRDEKQGGKELGYSSGLDLMLLYEDTYPDAPEVYSRLDLKTST